MFVPNIYLTNETLKSAYLDEAAGLMNNGAQHVGSNQYYNELAFLTRGILQLSRTSTLLEASKTFDEILKLHPTNLVALDGKVRSYVL